MMDLLSLSVLVPLRTDDFAFYRSKLVLRDALDLSDVETVVVDDGSAPVAAAQIEEFCHQRGYVYVRLDTVNEPFSLSRARNAGLRAARSEFVYMDDADLVYPHSFFQAVQVQLRLLHHTPFNFLGVPAVYLTAAASASVVADASLDASYPRVVQALLLEDPKGGPKNEVVQSYAPASGVLALRRELALQLGGYDETFVGWGGEDRDFVFRLLAANQQLPLPDRFRQTETWNLNDTLLFQGWRALHRLHGEFMARQGLYAVHLHHEKLSWRRPVSSGRNMQLAAENALATPVVERVEGQVFDLRQSVLFDIYRKNDLLDSADSRSLMERLQEANRLKERVRGVQRPLSKKLRKLMISPLDFFADSRFWSLRAVAKFFRG